MAEPGVAGLVIGLKTSDDHQLAAYEASPDGATASVVIVQEIFGVNAHIRSVVDRYAAQGYRAIAPAMFDRVERGPEGAFTELAYNADGVTRGKALRKSLSWDESILDLAAAVDRVSETGPVAVVGFCYGGSMAWLAASAPALTPNLAAAVGYYGAHAPGQFADRRPTIPTMLHFGALDKAIPLDGVNALDERYPEVAVHVYDEADHGFNCDARRSYHRDAAALAQQRTNDFLARHLGSS